MLASPCRGFTVTSPSLFVCFHDNKYNKEIQRNIWCMELCPHQLGSNSEFCIPRWTAHSSILYQVCDARGVSCAGCCCDQLNYSEVPIIQNLCSFKREAKGYVGTLYAISGSCASFWSVFGKKVHLDKVGA